MNLSIDVDKKTRKWGLYQNFNGENILLLETKTTVGGYLMDYSTGSKKQFTTPSGNFYLKRIVKEPFYYYPTWSKEYYRNKKMQKPGKKNDYGLVMAEICSGTKPSGYDFNPSGDIGVSVHATPHSLNSSHSCNRLEQELAENYIFPFIERFTPHYEPKKTARGTVVPFEKDYLVPYNIK